MPTFGGQLLHGISRGRSLCGAAAPLDIRSGLISSTQNVAKCLMQNADVSPQLVGVHPGKVALI